MRYLMLVAFISLVPLMPLQAQLPGAGRLVITTPAPPFAFRVPFSDARLHPLVRGASYWAEGGGIGAAVLGVLGIAVAAGLCSDSETHSSCFGPVVGSALLGAGVGFTVGALVGGRFPKH